MAFCGRVILVFVFASVLRVHADCNETAMDLVFLADSSGSVGEKNFDLLKQFLAEVVQGLVISLDKVRVALVRFSSSSDIIISLDDSTSKERVIAAIRDMDFKEGGTNTSGALAVTRKVVYTPEGGDREEVGDLVVVLTDGKPWYRRRAAEQALLLRETDVEIIALGIGRGTSEADLRPMSSGVVRMITNFDGLNEVVDVVRSSVCEVGQEAEIKKRKLYPLPSISSPPPPTTTASSPPPPTTTASSPPPPMTSASSPTPPPMTSASSPPPPMTSVSSPTPPPMTSASSPPPPMTSASSPPPPMTSASSPPPPMTSVSSPPPPMTSASSPTPPMTTASSPPPSMTFASSPPSPMTTASSPLPPMTTTAIYTMTTTETPSTTELHASETDCQSQKMDVVFVQDASYSVSEESFQQAKSFITHITQQLPIGPDKVRVAVVRYGTEADVTVKLSQSTDVSTVTDAIANMEHITGSTNTGLALRTVREQVLTDGRPEARAVVVVITDGESTRFRDTRRESKKLRTDNARLVWLYILANDTDRGNFGREREYMTIEGDPTFGAESFEALGDQAMQQILNASCQEDPEPETTTPEPTTTPATTPVIAESKTSTSNEDPTTKSAAVTTESGAGDTSPSSPSVKPGESFSTPSESSPSKPRHKEVTTSPAITQAEEKDAVTKGQRTQTDPKTLATDKSKITTGEPATPTQTGNKNTSPPKTGSTSSLPSSSENSTPSTKFATDADTSTARMTGDQNRPSTAGDSAEGAESRNRMGGESDDGAWDDNWANVVGVTVAGFALAAAATTACVYLAIVRRRNQEKRHPKHEP